MKYLAALGRVMLGAFFVMAGAGKFANPQEALLLLEQTGLLNADKIVWTIAAIELAGGTALVLGFATKTAAFLVAASVIFISVTLMPFWTDPNHIWSPMFLRFAQSMMPLAGLLMVLGFGPGPLSVDANE